MPISAQRATDLLKEVCGGQLNERAQRLVRTLPQDRKADNRNFLGAVGPKACPQRAQVEYPSFRKGQQPPAAVAPARPCRKPAAQILAENDHFVERLPVPPKTKSLVGATAKLQLANEFAEGRGMRSDVKTQRPRPAARPTEAPYATEPVARFGPGQSRIGASGLTMEEEGLFSELARDITVRRGDVQRLESDLAAANSQPIRSTDDRRRVMKQVENLHSRRMAAESSLRSGLNDLNKLVSLTDDRGD